MEKVVVELGSDKMCKCSCVDVCPLGKWGMEGRCMGQELAIAGVETIQNEWVCDFCCKPLKASKKVDTLHYRFGSVTLCQKCYRKQGNNVR
jgi:hypothetical protein